MMGHHHNVYVFLSVLEGSIASPLLLEPLPLEPLPAELGLELSVSKSRLLAAPNSEPQGHLQAHHNFEG
jgi:hypothetical protein